jgi:hypothetical protein
MTEEAIVDLIASEAQLDALDVYRLIAALDMGCGLHRRRVVRKLAGLHGAGRIERLRVVPESNHAIRAAALSLRVAA